jgi:RNA polymerase sigma-70 factor (ECF subfamily)
MTEAKRRAGLSDEEVIARIRAGEVDLFELLMRRYNQLVYRIARAVLRDDGKAEELAQEAWVRAFAHLDQFSGNARFSTWLSRIALYEGWASARRDLRFESIGGEESSDMNERSSPEAATLDSEVRSFLEAAVDALPPDYRVVFTLREIEELSTRETAEALQLTEQTVKNRLHRARSLLRRELTERAGPEIRKAFPFLAKRCDRIVGAVLARIGENPPILQ